MKPTRLIRSLAALCALTAIGSAFAAVGYQEPAAGFVSNKTRTEVIDELSGARSDGSAASSRIDGDDANIGARGVAGSRYSSMFTKDRVRSELTDQRSSHTGNTPNTPNDLYFGD